MSEISKDEQEKLKRENPHLKKYLESIQKKMSMPKFYSKIPQDMKGEENPNLIYTTKGVVFIHIYKAEGIEVMGISAVTGEGVDRLRSLISEVLE